MTAAARPRWGRMPANARSRPAARSREASDTPIRAQAYGAPPPMARTVFLHGLRFEPRDEGFELDVVLDLSDAEHRHPGGRQDQKPGTPLAPALKEELCRFPST